MYDERECDVGRRRGTAVRRGGMTEGVDEVEGKAGGEFGNGACSGGRERAGPSCWTDCAGIAKKNCYMLTLTS